MANSRRSSSMRTLVLSLVAISSFATRTPARAASDCPSNVTAAALGAHPGATVLSCKQENEHGRTQYEVRLATKEGVRMELDVSPEGKILLTEERIPLDQVPPAVTRALTERYPAAKPSRAERQTSWDGKVTYELAFQSSGRKKEVTFTADGVFVEEE
jgi:hypothetical protein